MNAWPALLLFSLAACGEQPAGKPVTVIELGPDGASTVAVEEEPQPAIQPAGACESVVFEEVPLTHCVADPAEHRIVTDLGSDDGAPYRSLAILAGSRGAEASEIAFAMNGGMFDDEGDPIGYYVENGERVKELNRAEGSGNFHMLPNGVFFGSDGKWEIRTSDDFYANVSERPQFGTQSGPMLLIDSELHPEISEDGPSENVRNGVGIDADGRAHFVISGAPLSFGKLARYFRDVLRTPNALYLDGSVSAMWDPARERLDSGAQLGPLIVVEKKGG